ncbi:hypothetical protein BGZ65_005519 [Modicella reniformis]|uniref:W2 domain-containing protein n=1 Tax=Modicella reniformis TaxID=1440133 RepID=A0A9P6IXE6_9FUNG|nr:hypothetical protein BGZ65_005519 [Modicella reniformis]
MSSTSFSSSSVRETCSDSDTLVTEEEDDKSTFLGGGDGGSGGGGASDSNDTDYSSAVDVDDSSSLAMDMDRRSRRKRSMQKLMAKSKMLKASLTQAKADLTMERHNRAMIDQIYLKIKKELNDKLEAEEIKVANLKAELKELKEKHTKEDEEDSSKSEDKDSSSYRIGYDSSNYSSLTLGLDEGLMFHHSDFLNGQDEEEYNEAVVVSSMDGSNVSSSVTAVSPSSSSPSSVSGTNSSSGDKQQTNGDVLQLNALSDAEQNTTDAGFLSKEMHEDMMEEKAAEDVEKKVTFREEPQAIPAHGPLPHSPLAEEEAAGINLAKGGHSCNDGEDDNDEEEEEEADDDNVHDEQEEAPCTMMELMIKKQQQQQGPRNNAEDEEIQDLPADANETFYSMAHKFLHQALHAKFTPARTILQLDDLLLKYDAPPEELVLVLAQETMRWWENERLETGGPTMGGWGSGTVLIPETGDSVNAREAVESKFKAIYVPLLLNYVASHQEQLMLLNKLEQTANSSELWKRNHPAELVALYKFDVLDGDAILEWWRLLKNELRSMSSKFVAWLEEEEEEEESDEDEEEEDDEDEEEDEDADNNDQYDFDQVDDGSQGSKIVGLDNLLRANQELMDPREILQSLDEDLAKTEAEKEEMMIIGGSDDDEDYYAVGIRMDDGDDDDDEDDDFDRRSTTSSLERIEERDRRRRISFCTNNVYIHQDDGKKIIHHHADDEDDRSPSPVPSTGVPTSGDEEEEEEEEAEDKE